MKQTVVAFGEIMMRLSAPEGQTVRESTSFRACYGGTESNVLACLAAFGHRTRYLTALPAGELGAAVLDHLSRLRVDASDAVIGGDTLGLYFSETGNGSRGARVYYFRRHSEFTRLSETSFDFDRVFRDAALFHVSGISFALSPSSRRLAFRLMREARARGIPVSFDFNYRAALWGTDAAGEAFREALFSADIVLGSPRDLDVFLGMTAEDVFARYPCAALVLRERTVCAPDRHSVHVRVLTRSSGEFSSPEVAFPVSERIGGGDAFNGAFLHAYLRGDGLKEATMFAIAAFARKHTIAGDVLACGEEEIRSYGRRLSGEEL